MVAFLRKIWSHRFWRGSLIVLGSLVVALLILFWWAFSNLPRVVNWAGGIFGQDLSVTRAGIHSWKNLQIVDLKFGSAARIGKLDVTATASQLIKGEIEEIRIQGGTIWLSEVMKQMGGSSGKAGRKIKINQLILNDVSLIVDTLGPGLPPVTIRLADVPPAIILKNIIIGGDGDDPALQQTQTATINHFTIYSPYDPLAQVLSFDEINLTFSWAGLRQQQIERIRFYRPRIYISPDLFWFADEVSKKKTGTAPALPANAHATPASPSQPWTIQAVDVERGQLIIAMMGEAALEIPGEFNGQIRDIRSDFEDVYLKSSFTSEIPLVDYTERYGVRIENVRASLDFNLPPADHKAQNLVRVFQADKLTWKGISFGEGAKNQVWLEMTFDRSGMFGKFGGPGSQGYLNGGLAVYFQQNLPWVAWGSAKGLNLKSITDILSPEDFKMDGPVDSEFKIVGASREVTQMKGEIILSKPGVMLIPAADQLLKRFPEDWSTFRKQLTAVPIEAFRRFDYAEGACSFSYMPPESYFFLEVKGKQGRRKFDIRWKDLRPELLSLLRIDSAPQDLKP